VNTPQRLKPMNEIQSNPTAGIGRGNVPSSWNIIGHQDKPPRVGFNATLPNAFHGAIEPHSEVKRERAVHRRMCLMSMAGMEIGAIAKALDYCPMTVSNILRQPWAQMFMQSQLSEEAEEFRLKIIAEGQAAFCRIVDRASNELVSQSLRHDADKELLNRYLGKAVQPIEQIRKPVQEKTDEELLKSLQPLLSNQPN
jgi:hypothetical protein